MSKVQTQWHVISDGAVIRARWSGEGQGDMTYLRYRTNRRLELSELDMLDARLERLASAQMRIFVLYGCLVLAALLAVLGSFVVLPQTGVGREITALCIFVSVILLAGLLSGIARLAKWYGPRAEAKVERALRDAGIAHSQPTSLKASDARLQIDAAGSVSGRPTSASW